MTEQKRKRVMYFILVIAVIWGIWNNPFGDRKRPSPQVQPTMAPSVQSLADSILQAQQLRAGGRQQADTKFPDIGWHKDPFSGHPRSQRIDQPVPRESSGPTLRLSGISSMGDQKMAIINGKLAGPQAVVDGWVVASITSDAVVLESGGRRMTLKLNGDR